MCASGTAMKALCVTRPDSTRGSSIRTSDQTPSMVIVTKKNRKLRICLSTEDMNIAIECEHTYTKIKRNTSRIVMFARNIRFLNRRSQ